MNRQQRKTVHTDMNSTMISLQLNNLILRPNLKPKTTSHSQNGSMLASTSGLCFPLSVEDPGAGAHFGGQENSERGHNSSRAEALSELQDDGNEFGSHKL
ncbi:MAG TPA: hypothetical protein VNA15_01995 [Candidatus Angelobacter sp.]|nr:hypothetical protein [Candidatus Angelobacter sp.]